MKQKLKSNFLVFTFVAFSVEYKSRAYGFEACRVSRYLDSEKVYLDCVNPEGLKIGDRLTVHRNGVGGVGTLKIKSIEGRIVEAKMIAEKSIPSEHSRRLRDYSWIMNNDSASLEQSDIKKDLAIATPKSLLYFDLFSDPDANPQSYSLEKGKDFLHQNIKDMLANSPVNILIESYVGQSEDKEALLSESIQRAYVIKDYIVQEFSLDPEDVIALGFGEAAVTSQRFLPGHQKQNRRIVLKSQF